LKRRSKYRPRYAAELYNVKCPTGSKVSGRKGPISCGDRGESRFSPDFEVPLSLLGIEVAGDPNLPREINCVQVLKEMAESMGFEVLHGIVNCLWVIGEPNSVFKEVVGVRPGF
jgi:hypothetical protein